MLRLINRFTKLSHQHRIRPLTQTQRAIAVSELNTRSWRQIPTRTVPSIKQEYFDQIAFERPQSEECREGRTGEQFNFRQPIDLYSSKGQQFIFLCNIPQKKSLSQFRSIFPQVLDIQVVNCLAGIPAVYALRFTNKEQAQKAAQQTLNLGGRKTIVIGNQARAEQLPYMRTLVFTGANPADTAEQILRKLSRYGRVLQLHVPEQIEKARSKAELLRDLSKNKSSPCKVSQVGESGEQQLQSYPVNSFQRSQLLLSQVNKWMDSHIFQRERIYTSLTDKIPKEFCFKHVPSDCMQYKNRGYFIATFSTKQQAQLALIGCSINQPLLQADLFRNQKHFQLDRQQNIQWLLSIDYKAKINSLNQKGFQPFQIENAVKRVFGMYKKAPNTFFKKAQIIKDKNKFKQINDQITRSIIGQRQDLYQDQTVRMASQIDISLDHINKNNQKVCTEKVLDNYDLIMLMKNIALARKNTRWINKDNKSTKRAPSMTLEEKMKSHNQKKKKNYIEDYYNVKEQPYLDPYEMATRTYLIRKKKSKFKNAQFSDLIKPIQQSDFNGGMQEGKVPNNLQIFFRKRNTGLNFKKKLKFLNPQTLVSKRYALLKLLLNMRKQKLNRKKLRYRHFQQKNGKFNEKYNEQDPKQKEVNQKFQKKIQALVKKMKRKRNPVQLTEDNQKSNYLQVDISHQILPKGMKQPYKEAFRKLDPNAQEMTYQQYMKSQEAQKVSEVIKKRLIRKSSRKRTQKKRSKLKMTKWLLMKKKRFFSTMAQDKLSLYIKDLIRFYMGFMPKKATFVWDSKIPFPIPLRHDEAPFLLGKNVQSLFQLLPQSFQRKQLQYQWATVQAFADMHGQKSQISSIESIHKTHWVSLYTARHKGFIEQVFNFQKGLTEQLNMYQDQPGVYYQQVVDELGKQYIVKYVKLDFLNFSNDYEQAKQALLTHKGKTIDQIVSLTGLRKILFLKLQALTQSKGLFLAKEKLIQSKIQAFKERVVKDTSKIRTKDADGYFITSKYKQL